MDNSNNNLVYIKRVSERLNKIENEKHYKFAAICFAIAGLSFLITSILGGFKTLNIVLSALFIINSIIFFSLGKMKNKKN